jgi:hypothetical protein
LRFLLCRNSCCRRPGYGTVQFGSKDQHFGRIYCLYFWASWRHCVRKNNWCPPSRSMTECHNSEKGCTEFLNLGTTTKF